MRWANIAKHTHEIRVHNAKLCVQPNCWGYRGDLFTLLLGISCTVPLEDNLEIPIKMQGFMSLNPPTAFLGINLLGIPLFLVIYPRIYLEISLISMNGGQCLNKSLFINVSEYYTVIKNEEKKSEEKCMSWHSNMLKTKKLIAKCFCTWMMLYLVNIFFNPEG